MEKFINEFEKEQERQISRIEASDACHLKKALEASRVLSEGIYRLKEFISGYTFRDMGQEIRFFKEIKPRLCSHVIYYRKIYNFEMNRPVGGIDIQRRYINRGLAKIQYYIDTRLDFFRYYRCGATYLDERYFTRNNQDLDLYLDTSFFERDPRFSTSCDDKVAKILANDMLVVFFKSELELLDHYQPMYGEAVYPKAGIRLYAKKTDILELLYALHSIGVFGKASLKSVVAFIEPVFNVNLDNFSRTFAEMKTRNEPTPFLDRLKKGLLERMGRYKNKGNR